MTQEYEGELSGAGLRVGIICARFNSLVTDKLLTGALDSLHRHGVETDMIDVYRVPGAFEIPGLAVVLTESKPYDAIICLGAVVRGDTPHFDYVCSAATKGLADLASEGIIPILFGILTTENMDQALDRAGGKSGNKGAELARDAIEMASLYRGIRDQIVDDELHESIEKVN